MDDRKEVDEGILSRQSDSPASAPSPSVDSAVTENVDLDHNLLAGADVPTNDLDGPNGGGDRDSPNFRDSSPSIKLSQELNASDSDGSEDFSPGERAPSPQQAQPRVIAVTPLPGNPPSSSPDIKSDHDSGVKIDEDEDIADSKTPEKRRTPNPSLASCEASSRSESPDRAEPPKPAANKGGSSKPPRFRNNVEPMEFHRPAAPAYNRAVHSLQCKAMIIIMSASIIAVIVVVAFIILKSGEGENEPGTQSASLDGSFNITNRLYEASYEDNSSNDYQQLSDEFISTMNATFQKSGRYEDLYNTTTVGGIRRSNTSTQGAARPLIGFTISLVISDSDLIGQDGVTTDSPYVTGSSLVSGPKPAVVDSIIGYLINVTESGNFGNFTGQMVLVSL